MIFLLYFIFFVCVCVPFGVLSRVLFWLSPFFLYHFSTNTQTHTEWRNCQSVVFVWLAREIQRWEKLWWPSSCGGSKAKASALRFPMWCGSYENHQIHHKTLTKASDFNGDEIFVAVLEHILSSKFNYIYISIHSPCQLFSLPFLVYSFFFFCFGYLFLFLLLPIALCPLWFGGFNLTHALSLSSASSSSFRTHSIFMCVLCVMM